MTAGRKINSKSKDWCTPPKYVTAVKEMLGKIYLDPCSNLYSIVQAETEYTENGLTNSWHFPTIYVNPPYGRNKEQKTTIKDWLRCCAQAHKNYQSEVLALVPVAANTKHWKEFIWQEANNICFLYDTRLKFLIDGSDENKGAPMACAMIYWGNNKTKFTNIFNKFGFVVNLR